jgi:hypothetical protein
MRGGAGFMVLLVLAATIGTARAQIQYRTDEASPGSPSVSWIPTAMEEEIRWHLNRGRFNPAAENALRGTSYAGLPVTAGPLAPHYSLTASSRRHSEDLARTNLFQHQTVPGSLFYNPSTQPNPSHRMIAEGYTGGSHFSENIAAGNSDGLGAYLAWWRSDPHRNGMYGTAYREMGNGYFHREASTWKHYHTMNLASAGSRHLFTGTVFHDANGNGAYNAGEGRGGVRISLRVNGTDHPHFDVSTAVGSFAIPIESISAGSAVEVRLRNPGITASSLSVPLNHSSLATFTMAPGEERIWGTFVKSSTVSNVGFRNLAVINQITQQPLVVPELTLGLHSSSRSLSWPSRSGHLYQVQWSADLFTWHNLTPAPIQGDGLTMTVSDSTPEPRRFYRLLVTAAP